MCYSHSGPLSHQLATVWRMGCYLREMLNQIRCKTTNLHSFTNFAQHKIRTTFFCSFNALRAKDSPGLGFRVDVVVQRVFKMEKNIVILNSNDLNHKIF